MHAERQTAGAAPAAAFTHDAVRGAGSGVLGGAALNGVGGVGMGPLAGRGGWTLHYGGGAALYLGTLLLCARQVTADGYDGAGFVLALGRLDLARWQPQPPGYPLLVLLGRVGVALGLPPALAVATVNAVLLGAGLGALAWGIRRLAGPAAGLIGALLLPVGPLAFALALSTLSDAAGLGALLLAVAPLMRPEVPSPRRLVMSGIVAGLALGVRPAYAPLAGGLLLLLAWQVSGRAAAGVALVLVLTSLGWLVPLAALVGPRALWALSMAHAQGHCADFGGVVRGALLATVGLGAVGPFLPLWAGLGGAALFLRPPRLWSVPARRLAGSLLALIAGYGLWVALMLPVDGHGRHALPLTVAVLALWAVVLGAARTAPMARRHPQRADEPQGAARDFINYRLLPFGTALALVVLWGYSARTAWAFRRSLAPGAALADYVVAHFPPETPLYGARAARQLDVRLGSGSARPAQYLGEVLADAGHRDLPAGTLLITSEVLVPAAAAPLLQPLGRFCYADPVPRWLRPDRFAQDCVTLFAYRVRP